MMLVILVYLADLCSSLTMLTLLVAILCGLFGGILYIFSYVSMVEAKDRCKEPDFETKDAMRVAKRFIITFFACVALSVIIPSQKTMYAMIGVYYAPKVVETVKDNALFNKSIKLLEKKIDKALSEE